MDYSQIFSLKGRTALIVGGTGGIGREIVKAFCQFGADVIIASQNGRRFRYFQPELEAAGYQVPLYQCDITQEEAVVNLFHKITAKTERIDILVNAAAVNILSPVLEYRAEDWDRTMEINLKGTFLCSREAAKQMIKQGYGKIIQFSSLAALRGHKEHCAYSASKAGVSMLTKVMAAELGKHHICVNAIAPSCTVTEVNHDFFDAAKTKDLVQDIPLNRLASPQDIVGAVLFLASSASDYISGTTLVIDGAQSAT